jgi:hypothetical protein
MQAAGSNRTFGGPRGSCANLWLGAGDPQELRVPGQL